MTERVAILDAGAQYSKVIDRRIRELNVHSEILPFDTAAEILKANFKAVIISGGPQSVYSATLKCDPLLFNSGIPILGICYGMQLLAHDTGGKVERGEQREDGQFLIEVSNDCLLFDGMEKKQLALLTHGDSVVAVGEGFKVVGTSGSLITAISCDSRKLYGVQFHPEVDLTENGQQIFKNFLFKIAHFSGNYTMEDREQLAIKYIKSRVGDKKVLVLVSGGVDSTVCAALLNKAIGAERVIPVHIDNGFMRKEETEKVNKALTTLGLKLRIINGSEEFYNATTEIPGSNGKFISTQKLNITTNSEEKRKIIGDTFMRIAQREIEKLGLGVDDVYLAQGTLRPDMIESGSPDVSKSASVIKTHHNDTNLVRQLRALGRVVEPLSDYHKDEVRRLGRSLGLPTEIVSRQPFPGPGLSIRIICCDTPFMDETFDKTNKWLHVITGQIETTGTEIPDELSKIRKFVESSLKSDELSSFSEILKQKEIQAELLPIKTVGVQGDGRTYSYACGLFMKNEPNWDHLFVLAKLIPRVLHNINRVIYVFGGPVNEHVTSVTHTHLVPTTIKLLQEADDIATKHLMASPHWSHLSQVPIILFPISFGKSGATHSIAIRTMITNDFMTGRPAVPPKEIDVETLKAIEKEITSSLPLIGRVSYDLTAKPPGTTEWE